MGDHTGETIRYAGAELRRLSPRAAIGVLLGRVNQRLIAHGAGGAYRDILGRLKLNTSLAEALDILGHYVYLVDTDAGGDDDGMAGAPVPRPDSPPQLEGTAEAIPPESETGV